MVRGALQMLAEADFGVPPPRIAEKLYPLLCETVGVADPYEMVRRECDDLAMALSDGLLARARSSSTPLRTFVKIALAGNVIDFGITEAFDLHAALDRLVDGEPDVDQIDDFERRLANARDVLYLADNAGEIALDRLLVEHGIGPSRVTLAVRGGPIINDAVRDDAERVGLSNLVPVIDPGVAVPGVALEISNEEFRRAFDRADLIVSKGQGNFETLEGLRDPRLFFVFMVKCKTVAQLTGCPLGSSVAAFSDGVFRT